MLHKYALLLIISLIIFFPASSVQAQLTGRDIAVKVDERDDGDDQRSESTMRLINKKGRERMRKLVRLTKEYGGDTKSVIVFLEPADVRGTGLLMFEYEDTDKDDDQWLYLPALKKVRRIAASGKGDSFMGTDFTYDDLGDRGVDEDEHNLLREETVDGYECYVLENIPLEEKPTYSRTVSWIIKDVWIPLKIDFFDRHGKLLKQMQSSDIREIDGIWTTMRLEMHNVQKNHRTVIEFENVQYNSGLKDSYFTQRTLKKGRVD